MGSDLLVSAICPTFNRPEYLLHSVDLFQRQVWKQKELIVIDDSDSKHQVDLSKIPNVRHVKLDGRATLGAKHNIGNEIAQGGVIAYWDDDDWWGPRRFVMQLEAIALGQAQLVGFRRNLILTTGAQGKWFKSRNLRIDPKLWVGNGATNLRYPIHDGSALFSRKVLDAGVQHPDQTMNEKVGFLNSLAAIGTKARYVHNVDLMVYVRHGANTWKYNEQILHEPFFAPGWFPAKDAAFYRRMAS